MLRLCRLSPARAVNVRYTTPGHASPHHRPPAAVLDPAHPAAKLPLRHLPVVVSPHFVLRALPKAILQRPTDFVPVNPLLATGLVRARTRAHTHARAWWSNLEPIPKERPRRATPDAKQRAKYLVARHLADARTAALAARGRHNVSLLFHTSKKATSKSCVIRRRLRSKMTAAIDLVVARNADAVEPPECKQPRKSTPYPPLTMVSRPPQDGESFILQDWTYLIVPDLAIYKMPLPNLVQAVRKALLSLSQQSKRLETTWAALPKHKFPKPSTDSQLSPKVTDGSPHPSEHARQPAKQQRTSPQLYLRRPVILPREKPEAK